MSTVIIKSGSTDFQADVTSANALKVTDSNTPNQVASTSTISRVASSASVITLLSANSARLGAVLYNESTQPCYVKFGTSASNTSYTIEMQPQTVLILEENPIYTGIVSGIWVSANGAMQVTELTA